MSQIDPNKFLKDYLYPSDMEAIVRGVQKFPGSGFNGNEEDMLIARGGGPKRKLVDILVPGMQDDVWTDIPGKMFPYRGDYGLLNIAPNKEDKRNILRVLPDPQFRNYVDESTTTPYFRQFGPRQFGTGSI